jgi:hypothetical protein
MRVHRPLTQNQRYPIPYINPPTELRVALGISAKGRILLCCVRGSDVVFPTIEFGTPAGCDTLRCLMDQRQTDLERRSPPECYDYVSVKAFLQKLNIDGPILRQRVLRLKEDLFAAVGIGWVDAVVRSDMLIENRRGRGYRLAPSVRVVSAESLLG